MSGHQSAVPEYCDLGHGDVAMRKTMASTGSVKPEEADRIVERTKAASLPNDHGHVARAQVALSNAMHELQQAIGATKPETAVSLTFVMRQLFPVAGMLTDIEQAMQLRGKS